jgi:Ca-activated chloride channel family protein
MRIETDRALIVANAESTRFLTVEITAPEKPGKAERTPVNVALVLDRSGSMGGQKIELAREAVAQAIRLLDTRDRLAIVVFDEQIDVVLESTLASPEAKALAERRLAEIDARGSTNLHAGWRKGADEVLRHITADPAATANRVLLLTDGQANAGTTDPDSLAAVAAELRAKGVATTTFGVGADFDEELLSRLATSGGGHFYFIEQPRQIPDLLRSELGEALEIVAPEAELVISAGDDVMVAVLNDLPVARVQTDFRIRLGDLVSGQVVRVVVQLLFASRLEGTAGKVQCRLADRAGALFPRPMGVEWMAADRDANAQQPVNSDVLVAAAEQIAARVSSAALAANRAGQFDKALELLTGGAKALRELGPIRAIERLARELERKRDKYSSRMNPIVAKQMHYESYRVSMSREPTGKARRS